MTLNMRTFPVWIALVALGVGAAAGASRQRRQAGGTCSTPRGEAGTCIGIRDCPPLLDLLRTRRNDPETVQFLRNSVCGGSGSNPSVCCPSVQPSDSRANLRAEEFPKLPSPPQCGTTTVSDHMKIVGGNPSELGAWPWIAALGYRSSSRPGPRWLCGGSLITDRYVLTAAHCTRHPTLSLYLVRLGEHDLNRTDDGASPVDIEIEKAVPHPAYSASKFTDDIALLRLKTSAAFTVYIQPICLPKTGELRQMSFEKFFPFVAGWGSTSFRGPSSSRLMEVQLPVTTGVSCQAAYKPKGTEITPRQLCAGFPSGGKDACQGDSGGPLMLPRGSSYYLIGVVSYGFKCAEAGFPGIYARTTSYIEWISNNIN